MTEKLALAVAGAAELVGRGVFVKLPPEPRRHPGGHGIVVTGRLPEAVQAGLRLCAPEHQVTVVTQESGGTRSLPPSLLEQLRTCRQVTVHTRTAVVWAVGVDHLEAVVLRHLPTRRIVVCNASALFILSSPGQQP